MENDGKDLIKIPLGKDPSEYLKTETQDYRSARYNSLSGIDDDKIPIAEDSKVERDTTTLKCPVSSANEPLPQTSLINSKR